MGLKTILSLWFLLVSVHQCSYRHDNITGRNQEISCKNYSIKSYTCKLCIQNNIFNKIILLLNKSIQYAKLFNSSYYKKLFFSPFFLSKFIELLMFFCVSNPHLTEILSYSHICMLFCLFILYILWRFVFVNINYINTKAKKTFNVFGWICNIWFMKYTLWLFG